MTQSPENAELVFKARRSIAGWISSIALFVLSASGMGLAILMGTAGISKWLVVVPTAVLCAASVFFSLIFPFMTYAVNSETAIFRCGPFDWRIPITAIRSITELDLEYLPYSEGWKLPGYALFSMRFGNVGKIRMCATSLTKRIVVIEVDKGLGQADAELWGITPADSEGFAAAVRSCQDQY